MPEKHIRYFITIFAASGGMEDKYGKTKYYNRIYRRRCGN